MATGVGSTTRSVELPRGWAAILALPLLGLLLVLARPELDLQWEHHPAHFWLVLSTAVVNVVLAYITNIVAVRQRDARLLLVSLAFLSSAGFLGLHALATPGVLLDRPNVGFATATPIGLVLAAVFAALSASPLGGPQSATVLRYRNALTGGLLAAMGVWAVLSLARIPPLDGAPPTGEAIGALRLLSIAGVVLYAIAAWRYLVLYRRSGRLLPFTIAVAFVLLAEATVAVAFSRNWHASWWEWHVLMLLAFASIALGARAEYRRAGSLTGAFGGLYLDATLRRIDRWHAGAIAAVASAAERGEAPDRVLDGLRREGASADEVALIVQAAEEVRRLDERFRPYLPQHVAERLAGAGESAGPRLGGEEREVSVLFADLASFTTYSETHSPTTVIAMLNEYWAVVVPVIDAGGGVIEQFAGDGVMAIYNVLGDQPDHAGRAAQTGIEIVETTRFLAEAHPDWPIFRVGVNTGPAVVGNVGAEGRLSFAAIGDTVNVAARLMSAGGPGQVVAARSTWVELGGNRAGEPLGAVELKGKREPVEAWLVSAA